MKTIKLLTFTQQSLDHKFLLVSSHLVEDSGELRFQVLRWSKSCWCWRWFWWWRSSLRRFDCLVLRWFGSDILSWACIIDVGINGLNLALFRRLVRYCCSFLFLSIIITLLKSLKSLGSVSEHLLKLIVESLCLLLLLLFFIQIFLVFSKCPLQLCFIIQDVNALVCVPLDFSVKISSERWLYAWIGNFSR